MKTSNRKLKPRSLGVSWELKTSIELSFHEDRVTFHFHSAQKRITERLVCSIIASQLMLNSFIGRTDEVHIKSRSRANLAHTRTSTFAEESRLSFAQYHSFKK